MPELPEVENLRRQLAPEVAGRTLLGVTHDPVWAKLVRDPESLSPRLEGRTIEHLDRRAKYLLFRLDGGGALMVHLGMSGWLQVLATATELPRHTRVTFALSGESSLVFTDVRGFGRVALLAPEDLVQLDRRLGPEPLASGWHATALAEALTGRKAPLKALLLQQELVGGLGNIYADEALWRARLQPARAAGTLAESEVRALHRAIRSTLRDAVAHGARPDYRGGDKPFAAYGRTGEPCPRCGTPITRVVIGGRSTHYCPRCQPENG